MKRLAAPRRNINISVDEVKSKLEPWAYDKEAFETKFLAGVDIDELSGTLVYDPEGRITCGNKDVERLAIEQNGRVVLHSTISSENVKSVMIEHFYNKIKEVLTPDELTIYNRNFSRMLFGSMPFALIRKKLYTIREELEAEYSGQEDSNSEHENLSVALSDIVNDNGRLDTFVDLLTSEFDEDEYLEMLETASNGGRLDSDHLYYIAQALEEIGVSPRSLTRDDINTLLAQIAIIYRPPVASNSQNKWYNVNDDAEIRDVLESKIREVTKSYFEEGIIGINSSEKVKVGPKYVEGISFSVGTSPKDILGELYNEIKAENTPEETREISNKLRLYQLGWAFVRKALYELREEYADLDSASEDIDIDETARTFVLDNFPSIDPFVDKLLDIYEGYIDRNNINDRETSGINHARKQLEKELSRQGIQIGDYTDAIQNEIDTGYLPELTDDQMDAICSEIRHYEMGYLHEVVDRWKAKL